MRAEATRLTRIQPSPSTLAAAKARELREQGVRVLDLTVGEPDFDTPANVKLAGIAAIQSGQTKYTAVNGTPALRRAIIERLVRVTGITCFRFDDEIDEAIQLLVEHPWISRVITHVIPADKAIEAFDLAKDSQESGKVVLSLWLEN